MSINGTGGRDVATSAAKEGEDIFNHCIDALKKLWTMRDEKSSAQDARILALQREKEQAEAATVAATSYKDAVQELQKQIKTLKAEQAEAKSQAQKAKQAEENAIKALEKANRELKNLRENQVQEITLLKKRQAEETAEQVEKVKVKFYDIMQAKLREVQGSDAEEEEDGENDE